MDNHPTNEQRTDVPDQAAEPTATAPDREQPDSATDAPTIDPGPAKIHGDPLTDIDEEIRGGGGGND